jgi:cbb3-type cytochrome oxidase maturation protein
MALLIALLFLIGFYFAVKNGQYDDLDTPSHRILINDNYNEDEK